MKLEDAIKKYVDSHESVQIGSASGFIYVGDAARAISGAKDKANESYDAKMKRQEVARDTIPTLLKRLNNLLKESQREIKKPVKMEDREVLEEYKGISGANIIIIEGDEVGPVWDENEWKTFIRNEAIDLNLISGAKKIIGGESAKENEHDEQE